MAPILGELAKRLPSISSLVRKNDALKVALVASDARADSLEVDLAQAKAAADRPHFVSDYQALVRDLMAKHPLDEAMSLAVGGFYDLTGIGIVEVLRRCGLQDGMSIVDMGCGSGRVAKHLGLNYSNLSYVGFDIVQELLDYAALQSPPNYRFVLNHTLSVPAETASADMYVAFSVFTHLLHEETYIYLDEAKRVLKPGGVIVFSFLEMTPNWLIFSAMVNNLRAGTRNPHLNQFIERGQIQVWAEHLGLTVEGFDYGLPHQGHGQTVVMLRKPA